MSASEIVFAAGAAAVGVAAGSLAIFFYTRNVSDRKASVQPASLSDAAITNERKEASEQSDKGDSLSSSQFSMTDQPRSIPKNELEKSKRELRTLLVEKELVSAALTRLYEAEASKEITRSEREILGAKYVAELKSLDDRIIKMDAFIQSEILKRYETSSYN